MTDDPDRLARLERVYAATGREELASGYAAWAGDYDADVMAMGYQSPNMVAAMVTRHVPAPGGTMLDAGCGTGLLGVMLRPFGYVPIIGIDMSAEMLAAAKARRCYDGLRRMVMGERLDFPDGAFGAAVASGVFTAGHAPASSFDELARVVRPGGRLVFGLRHDGDHGNAYRETCDRLVAAGRLRLVEESRPFRAFLLSREEAHVLNVVRAYAVA